MKLIKAKWFSLAVFCFVTSLSIAQPNTDSLFHLLSEVKNEQKADLLIELCKAFAGRDNDKSLFFGNECLKLSDSINYLSGKSEAHCRIGIAYYYQSKYSEALNELKKAFPLKEELKDSINLGNILLLQGVIYAHFSDHNQAIEKYTDALKIYESINDKNGISSCYSNIGLIHQDQEEYEKAIEYSKKSTQLQLELENYIKVAKNYNNLGVLYELKGDLKRAMEFYQKAVKIYEKEDFLQSMYITYNNIGSIYTKEGSFNDALYYLNKSFNGQKQLNSVKGQSSALLNISKLFIKKKEYQKALKYLNDALVLADSSSYLSKKLEIHNEYYHLYLDLKDLKKALQYHLSYTTLKDTITKNQHKENVLRLQTLFETEQKDKEIKLLNAENELKNEQIRRQKTLSYLQAAVLLLFLITAFLIHRMYRKKKKVTQLLETQNKFIKEQSDEIKSQNEQLETQTKQLQELDELKSTFFANISHEFRTPLTLILGPAEQLLQQNNNDKTTKGLNFIVKHAKRLKHLIDQLLEISKIEKGAIKLETTKSNISAFIKSIIEAFEPWVKEKGINLKFSSHPENLDWYFDSDKMEKIFNNLLSNAIKFSKEHSEIVVKLLQGDNLIQLIIRDTGIGIAPNELSQIFNRFYRAGDPKEKEGSGIGLSLTKELVELHGGKINVESEQEKGTTFTITLPAIVPNTSTTNNTYLTDLQNINTQKQPNKIKHINKQAQSVVKSILIVEDNVDMQQYIASCLKDYEIDFAENGKKGLEKAIETNPDLVISDIMMPILNGYEMTCALKENELTSHIPVIMLTAKASEESLIAGFACNADDYLTKPFSPNELNARIKSQIRNRERLIDKFRKNISVNPSEISTTSADELFLQKALKIIEENMQVSDFSVEDFVEKLGASRANLHRKLKALTGLSTTEFIRSIRLKRAAQLIQNKVGNVSDVAYEVGFTNLSYFTRCFKEEFKCTPSEFAN